MEESIDIGNLRGIVEGNGGWEQGDDGEVVLDVGGGRALGFEADEIGGAMG